ncbi:spermatogenesis-associated protein 20 isoform X4 [Ixodes scapularis]|uniref:spermatogenesis-associated protein 20 isoform X4 n=1 Tax=Ixodes scapularis TaxID=6945 RepID=UPI001A9DFD4A|nr:spermatogenesis-associated protein 20 isoform X4 [Ixodes scapularis]
MNCVRSVLSSAIVRGEALCLLCRQPRALRNGRLFSSLRTSPGRVSRRSPLAWCSPAMACSSSSVSAPTGGGAQGPNRLAGEKSPYLLQHANNPVDWYPWGDEAIARAKSEDKPIFLSVGYSTCHWCHVMERESFENADIARLMNEHFVNVKVDREERPDLDRVYMTYIQATSGGGGWPMSVWLTPDLKPIVGGTYFPPDDRYFGRPGFKTLLAAIAEQWRTNRAKLLDQGSRIVEILRQASDLRSSDEREAGAAASTSGSEAVPRASTVAATCFEQLSRSYDEAAGGFGKAPKFPQCVNLNFLLRHAVASQEPGEAARALEMCVNTLNKMARGGIHDHVAKGFHRYSTDGGWHVPHFEKMLYDQAQLARAYLEAFQATRDPHLAQVARDVLDYVERDLSHQSGGFYSAEDADSLPEASSGEKKEGAFCVWEEAEVRRLLPEPLPGCPGRTVADLFCRHFGVEAGGNVDPMQDPHDELKGKNVLVVRESQESLAERFGLELPVLRSLLEDARRVLLEARQRRPRPHLDDKFLAAWNGLMVSGFATAAKVLGDRRYAERALQAVAFLGQHLYDEDRKSLLRSAYRGEGGHVTQTARPIPGVLEDYAFTVQGLLDTYEACFEAPCLLRAEELQDAQDARFWDPDQGGYFLSSGEDAHLLLRLKDDQDGAEPSPNSVSLSNLVRLSVLLNRADLRERAQRLAEAYARRLSLLPLALPEMVCGLLRLQAGPQEVVVAGGKDHPGTQELLSCLRGHFLPFLTTILADQDPENPLRKRLPNFDAYKCVDGKPTAYVCRNFVCSKPVTSAVELERLLQQK